MAQENKFFICSCGFMENNHHFWHEYKDTIEISEEKGGFLFDAESFQIKTKRSDCLVPQCGRNKYMHDTGVIPHPFVDKEVMFREVKFSIPETYKCVGCKQEFKEHFIGKSKCNFDIKIMIKNLTDSDVVNILDPDGVELTKSGGIYEKV